MSINDLPALVLRRAGFLKMEAMEFEDIDHEMTEENKASFDSVANALDWSKEYGMEVNVIYYALMFLKTNPAATIADAIEFGLDEWLK